MRGVLSLCIHTNWGGLKVRPGAAAAAWPTWECRCYLTDRLSFASVSPLHKHMPIRTHVGGGGGVCIHSKWQTWLVVEILVNCVWLAMRSGTINKFVLLGRAPEWIFLGKLEIQCRSFTPFTVEVGVNNAVDCCWQNNREKRHKACWWWLVGEYWILEKARGRQDTTNTHK